MAVLQHQLFEAGEREAEQRLDSVAVEDANLLCLLYLLGSAKASPTDDEQAQVAGDAVFRARGDTRTPFRIGVTALAIALMKN